MQKNVLCDFERCHKAGVGTRRLIGSGERSLEMDPKLQVPEICQSRVASYSEGLPKLNDLDKVMLRFGS